MEYQDVRQPRPLHAAPDKQKVLPAALGRSSIGALPYKTLGKKTYYSEEDVLTFLSEHVKDFRKEDIALYKARIHNFFNK